MRLTRMFSIVEASAHCDLPCGVYDPAQARIEAESVKAIQEKYEANDDPVFRTRAILIKEQRAELVKHHLWVLWTDYFKPPHFEKYPQLHQLFNEATKLAGAAGAKGTVNGAEATKLLDKIDEIANIFRETKQASWAAAGARSGARRHTRQGDEGAGKDHLPVPSSRSQGESPRPGTPTVQETAGRAEGTTTHRG